MHSPKAPAPDPAIAAAQATEQRRAEAGQVAQTQSGLNADTVALRRRFGVMASSVGGSSGGFTGVTPPSSGLNGMQQIFSVFNGMGAFGGGSGGSTTTQLSKIQLQ